MIEDEGLNIYGAMDALLFIKQTASDEMINDDN